MDHDWIGVKGVDEPGMDYHECLRCHTVARSYAGPDGATIWEEQAGGPLELTPGLSPECSSTTCPPAWAGTALPMVMSAAEVELTKKLGETIAERDATRAQLRQAERMRDYYEEELKRCEHYCDYYHQQIADEHKALWQGQWKRDGKTVLPEAWEEIARLRAKSAGLELWRDRAVGLLGSICHCGCVCYQNQEEQPTCCRAGELLASARAAEEEVSYTRRPLTEPKEGR